MVFTDPTPTQPIPVITATPEPPEPTHTAAEAWSLGSLDSTPGTRSSPPVWPLILVAVIAVVLIALNLSSGDSDEEQERVAVPLGGRAAAVIHIDSGADSIVVGIAELGDDLAVVTTPGGDQSGVRPRTRIEGDQLRVWTEDVGAADAGAAAQIDIRLASGVLWDVVVDKGAKKVALALGSGKVNLVELRGGADLAEITLPKPVGEQTVRIPTGLATATLHTPTLVPAKIMFGSGAGRATVDGAQKQGVATGTTIYGANGKGGFTAAKDRLLVDVIAGVGTLNLDRT
jgi:hypothetical protein